MFGRKKKTEPEQGSEGRQVARPASSSNPAFSYYTSRTPAVPVGRRTERQERAERQEPAEGREQVKRSRSRLAQLPFWLLIAVFVVCVAKVTLLSTSPKVVVVGKNSTAANYLQSSETYASAGQKQLASSILNRSKLTVDLEGTSAALKRQFPELQVVTFGLPLIGSRPIMYVQVAQPSLIVQSNQGNYALNASGVVLAKLRTVPSGVPVVVDQSESRPTPGKQLLPGGTVSFIQTVAYQFDAAHIGISTFVLPADAPYELDVRVSDQPYRIRMNLTADARVQSGAAIATLQQLGSAVPGEYLDVRTPDRVYYR